MQHGLSRRTTAVTPGTSTPMLVSLLDASLHSTLPKCVLTFQLYCVEGTTNHTWHGGRAKYTLIRIPASHKLGTGSNAAELAPKGAPVSTTATDNGAGSVDVREINVGASTDDPMQLIVGKGWWKRSELVDENGYCLISETVMPGWHPNDHAFLSRSDLAELFPGNEAWVKANERHTLETVIFT